MRVKARLAGAFLPRSFTGRVSSVHEPAINLLCADGLLVSIVADPAHMTGRSVRVDAMPSGAVVCSPCGGSASEIRLGASTISLAGVERWSGTPAPAALPGDLAPVLRVALRAEGRPGGLLSLANGAADNPFAARARSLLSAGDASLLVGLGPGSTPAGDDFLCGLLLGLRLLGSGPAEPGGETALAARLLGAPSATTAAGLTLLHLALLGSFPAYLLRLAEDLHAARDDAGVASAVRRAAGFGETSGTDAVVGLWWAAGIAPGPGFLTGRTRNPTVAARPQARRL